MGNLLIVGGLIGGGLWYFNAETINLYTQYKKIKNEKGDGGYPIDFQRPPKEVWQSSSDLIYQPGMPEGDGAVLPVDNSFHDLGIFGTPKTNVQKSNILYPLYRTECLFL